MKISEVEAGTIIYDCHVFSYDIGKPNYMLERYVVVLPEHNIVRGFDYKGDLNDNTQQINREVFLSEKDALLFLAKGLEENFRKIKEVYENAIETVLKKAVTKIEEAV